MNKLITATLIIISIHASGQTLDPITITEQSISITGSLAVASWQSDHSNQRYPDYPKLYYGFAEGDEIIIDFSMENKKGTNLLEVSEYESKSVVYSNKGFQTLENVRIKVPKTAVYKFEFATNHMFDRSGKVFIKRVPASASTKNFNSNVTWKTISDTTFTTVEEKVKISSTLTPVTIQTPIDYFINSGSNATFKGGKSRISFPITLPENTVEWYYTFGATRNDNDVQSTQSAMNLFGDLTKALDRTGALSFGLNAISQPPGANYCDVYLLKPEHFELFLSKTDGAWTYIPDGTRENIMSGIVRVNNCCKEGRYYIGLKNPDMSYGVHVLLEIVAITEKVTYETRQVKKPGSIATKKIPMFGS